MTDDDFCGVLSVFRDQAIAYNAPERLAHTSFEQLNFLTTALGEDETNQDCTICLSLLNPHDTVVRLGCGHLFHRECLEQAMKHKPICPTCRKPVQEPQGSCPSGTMRVTLNDSSPCPGFYDSRGSISINYSIPNGRQKSFHENPGVRYAGTNRTAYLPNNQEGRELLCRLVFAWKHGLIFTVGTSLTTHTPNSVVWNSIHHKTSLSGGPHGFPDSEYIFNCNECLDALYVPDAPTCKVTFCGATQPTPPPFAPDTATDRNQLHIACASAPFAPATSAPPAPFAPASSRSQSGTAMGFFGAPNTPPVTAGRLSTASPLLNQIIHYNAPKRIAGGRKPINRPQGTCPSGAMTINVKESAPCPGFHLSDGSQVGTIRIVYSIPGGRQKSYHQNPGVQYEGTQRTSYLPHTKEGEDILFRLIYAWNSGLIFTVGTSLTTGKGNSVVWTSIPHKTSLHGGLYGFPDSDHLRKCGQALDVLCVPDAETCRVLVAESGNNDNFAKRSIGAWSPR